MNCKYNFCDGDFEKCYNNKCNCPCHRSDVDFIKPKTETKKEKMKNQIPYIFWCGVFFGMGIISFLVPFSKNIIIVNNGLCSIWTASSISFFMSLLYLILYKQILYKQDKNEQTI